MFKILHEIDEGMYHSVSIRGLGSVVYPPGVWVRAPEWLAHQGYHLTVFNTLMDVALFSNYFGKLGFYRAGMSIWKVECDGEIYKLPQYCRIEEISRGYLYSLGHTDWPQGTRMFKQIRLVRELQFESDPLSMELI